MINSVKKEAKTTFFRFEFFMPPKEHIKIPLSISSSVHQLVHPSDTDCVVVIPSKLRQQIKWNFTEK